MEVLQQLIIKDESGRWQIAYSCLGGKCFVTSNGAFGQRETYLTEITQQEYDRLHEQG